MNTANPTANEGAEEIPTVKTNMSISERIAQRTQELSEPETAEVAPESQPEATSVESEPVLSNSENSNLEEPAPETFAEPKTRAEKRISELTAKRKEAEERAEKLATQLSELKKGNVATSNEVVENPYRDIDTIEGLETKVSEAVNTIKWANSLLDDAGIMSADDVLTTIEGKDFTKSQVRELREQAQDARDKHIPAQADNLQAKAQAEGTRLALEQEVTTNLSWMTDTNSEAKKHYDAGMSNPLIQNLLASASPEAAAYLPYLLAHTANSLYGGQKAQVQAVDPSKLDVKPTLTSPPVSAPAGGGNQDKQILELQNRYKKTGNMEDRIAWRTAQLAQTT